MTSPEITVKFFEHEDNPLPEDGSVHIITTGDGIDLRLGLWPVPGFKISIAETSGDSGPEGEKSSGVENGTTEVSSGDSQEESPENPAVDPPVSAGEPGAEPENTKNASAEPAGEPGSVPDADGTATPNDDAGETLSVLTADDANSDIAAATGAGKPGHDIGNAADPNSNDTEQFETVPEQADGLTQAGASSGSDEVASAGDATGANTAAVSDADPDNGNVTGSGEQAGEDDRAPEPEVRTQPGDAEPGPDDDKTVAASSREPMIAEDIGEPVEEPDAASTGMPANQDPVVEADSETMVEEGKDNAADTPSADEQADPAEIRASQDEPSNGEPAVETQQPGIPLEQAITMSGTIIVLNGRSEFIEKYAEVIHELIDRGFCVAALDWRGQGGSERLIKQRPLKGHVDDMDSYVEDLTTLLDFLETTNCPKPYYCLAHSTGGQVLLRAAPLISSRISRAVTTAPFLDLATYRTPKPMVYAFASTLTYAGLGEMYAPGAGRNPPSDDPFEGNAYSSDPRRYKRTADLVHTHEELAVGAPTVSWMYAALKSADELFDPDFLSSITLPIMMLSASDDKVVSVQAVEDFASMARTVSHLSIPGARHEILMERDEIRSQFWAAFDAFIPGED